MRPKLLEIEGLQSFTDVQRIDFESLSETGIFGIFGPTGSGKSTILDAITFALYGRVKRADGGTQGIINSCRNTARVSFTFELARDGKRRVYRVERTYQRKKNSPNACEPKVARLIEVTGAGEVPLCDKAMEVSYFIKDLLGLSNEDFTRAVVLPQNSFQEFLLLNNSDRRGMLERIFYLEEYGKQLLDKLGRKIARLRSRLDVMSGELMGYADASDEALETAKKAMEAAVAERNRIGKELKQSELQFNEAKEVWSLLCELADLNRKEGDLTAAKEDIAQNRVQLEKAVKADSLLEMIIKNRDLNEKLTETQKQLNGVLMDLPGVTSGLEEIKVKYESIKKEAVSEQPKLLKQRTRLVDALGIRTEIAAVSVKIHELKGSLDSLNSVIKEKDGLMQKEMIAADLLEKELVRLRQEMGLLRIDPEYRQCVQDGAKMENDVAVLRGNLKELEGKRLFMAAAANGLEQRLKGIRETVGTAQKDLDELSAESQKQIESKPGDRNAILKAVQRIHTVQGIYNILKLRKDELDRMKARIGLQQGNLSDLRQKAISLDKAKDLSWDIFEKCRLELDNANREMDKNTAYILSKHLRDGEACPVCGSAQHPMPAVHTVEADVAEIEKKTESARKNLADAEQSFRNAEREAITANDQVKTAMEQSAESARDMERKTVEYEEEKQKLPEKLKFLELELVNEELESTAKLYATKLEAFEAWEIKQGEYRENLQKLSDVLAGHRLAENAVVTELKVNQDGIGQLESSIAERMDSANSATELCDAFLRKVKIESASGELKRFSENDRRIHLLEKENEQVLKDTGVRKVLLDKLKEELRLMDADQIKLEAEINGLSGQKLEKEIKLKELAGDADIDEEIRRIDAVLESYTRLEREYQKGLQIIERQFNELVTRKSLLENQQDIYSESLKSEELRLKTALSEKGFSDAAEVECSILPTDRQKELKAGIDEYDQTLSNTLAQKGMLYQKLKSRTVTEEEWNRINSTHTELTAIKEECVSRSEIAKSSYEMLKIKHEKWAELGSSYAELNRKQGLFEQIGKILKAEHRKDNSFIDYIAEERLRYVAAKASETIGVMTKYRYALELDVEAGFIIRDNANGGSHRMVTSLSGGETFLTSLSLALALSEQIQLKGQSPLEFFFLDEGFGTLDADLLDTVIDALERLSSRERVIGLISHVPELKSRIARRLVVEPPMLQNQGSRVFIEKA